MQRILQRIGKARAVVVGIDREAHEPVIARLAFLRDALVDACDADASAPDVGEFAPDRYAAEDRVLVVGSRLCLSAPALSSSC